MSIQRCLVEVRRYSRTRSVVLYLTAVTGRKENFAHFLDCKGVAKKSLFLSSHKEIPSYGTVLEECGDVGRT